MEIVISNKEKFVKFSSIFRHLPLFMDMVNIHVDEFKMYVQGMDSAQVCLFELRLDKEWFDSYKVEKSCVLGIHCNTFYKVIQCIEDKEQEMKLMYKDGDDLEVLLKGTETNKVDKYFQLPLIDIDSDMLQIPSTEYSVDMEITSGSITNYINELAIFDETFTLSCGQDNIVMKSKSESGGLSIIIKDEAIVSYAIEEDNDFSVDMDFSLKYVKDMCTFSKITDTVIINIKNETPMRFHQTLDDSEDAESSTNYIRMYIAPKFED
tara:strand:- start:2510 stop:3304 length:795 start_codon:yes stop_codon:yes gene_type:complete